MNNRKIDIIAILLFLLMIAGGILIAFLGDCNNKLQLYSYIIFISLGAGFGAAFLTGKIIGEGKFGFINIKSASGGVFVWLITLATFIYYFPNSTSIKSTESIPKKTKSVKIVILKSGEFEYANTILFSFFNTLRDSLKHTKYELEIPRVVTGMDDTYKNEVVRKDFREKLENIFYRGGYDYYITIGTAASKALMDYKKDYNVSINHLFLGVTDPVSLGLCSSMEANPRIDLKHKNVGGVAYCGYYRELPNKIHDIFPDDKICFLYNSNIIEDGQIANKLRDNSLREANILKIIKLNRDPIEEDFSDKETVYFSWSTFDDFFSYNSLVDKKIKVVSPNGYQAKYGLVPVAVGTNDKEIGEQGALILLHNLLKNIPLEKTKIYIPKWRTFINNKLAWQYNIPDKILKNCDIKY